MAGVIERRPKTISLMARGETPMALAKAFCETSIGIRYSSKRISPGVMSVFILILITYNVIGGLSMVIHNGHFGRAIFCPTEDNPPLIVDPDGMQARQIPGQAFEPVAGWNGRS